MAAARSNAAVSFNATMRFVILRGTDTYLREAYTRQLREALEAEHGEVGVFSFDGRTAEPADVLDELRCYGLLQSYKLVVVDYADKLLAAPDPDDDAPVRYRTARQLFESYAAGPVDSATLLFRSEGWRPGKLDKAVVKVGAVVKCDEPSAATAIRWVSSRCPKAHGCPIAPDAASFLVDRIGPNLTRLDTELGKLAAAVGDGGTIDTTVIRSMVELSREEKAWLIQSCLLRASPAQALEKLAELIDVSQQPQILLSWAILDLLRKLHGAARMRAAGMPRGAISKALKLWGDATYIVDVAAKVPPERLAALLHEAVLSDRGSKSGLGKSRRNLEVLTVRIADTLC